MKNLTIISHTKHYLLANGSVVGLGATVTEINQLLTVFDRVIHVAMLHHGTIPTGFLPYTNDKISFMALPAVGGNTFKDKIDIVWQAPKIIKIIKKALKPATHFQFRAPTGIGVFVIPYLIWFSSKKGWFKYAGNWKQPQAPLAYRFQKWLLQKQSRLVTINGFWDDQPKHCLSFENPCLTEEEIRDGQNVIAHKTLQFPLELCFVGRLEPAKGVDLIIDAVAGLGVEMRDKIGHIHIVGQGMRMEAYMNKANAKDLPIVFHGHVSRTGVHDFFKRSHAMLLPSASEGFPKVIAEALNYGCIPIVSNISAISQYIRDSENGFIMEELTVSSLKHTILRLLELNTEKYVQMSRTTYEFIHRFGYNYYNQRLLKDVL